MVSIRHMDYYCGCVGVVYNYRHSRQRQRGLLNMEYLLNILDGYSVDTVSDSLYSWDWIEFYGELR